MTDLLNVVESVIRGFSVRTSLDMDFLSELTDVSPTSIAAAVGSRIRSGDLPSGTRLPTVREIAAILRVSPGTVAGAWHALAESGLIASRGRKGTFVLEQNTPWLPPRYGGLAHSTPVPYRLDLSSGTPDPQLLPTVGPAFSRLGRRTTGAVTSSYLGQPILPLLEKRLRAAWSYPPEEVTVVDGALDGLTRVLETLIGVGSRVGVEAPSFPPFLDLIDVLGAQAVPMAIDAHGVTPQGVEDALNAGCTVLVIQPRAQNPTGATMTPERTADLAAVVREHPRGSSLHIIEDDHCGAICPTADLSLGTHLPDQVVHIHSYSKSHGPDLRIAALGGPRPIVQQIVARRMLGPGWTSRILQTVLLELLNDRLTQDHIASARAKYASRRKQIIKGIESQGIPVLHGEGLNIWVPVINEQATVVYLAAQGIRVAPGGPFTHIGSARGRNGAQATAPSARTALDTGPHVRVSTGNVRENYDELGALIGRAAQMG
ncbi:PLP-dependent aminotransferase family protein [Populibacterium corticicola]|uniref:PLP-dependent aminotransferase family protein n=1 Tax=Populibacterium corticicola TaxID=1812826 RepID=A0ABW5XB50_9MICO